MKDRLMLVLAAVMLLAVVKYDELDIEVDGFKLKGVCNGTGDD